MASAERKRSRSARPSRVQRSPAAIEALPAVALPARQEAPKGPAEHAPDTVSSSRWSLKLPIPSVAIPARSGRDAERRPPRVFKLPPESKSDPGPVSPSGAGTEPSTSPSVSTKLTSAGGWGHCSRGGRDRGRRDRGRRDRGRRAGAAETEAAETEAAENADPGGQLPSGSFPSVASIPLGQAGHLGRGPRVDPARFRYGNAHIPPGEGHPAPSGGGPGPAGRGRPGGVGGRPSRK